jgi:hypothetical protein
VERIFAASDRASAMAIIEDPRYAGKTGYWNQIVGTRGFKGEKTMNAHSLVNEHFEIIATPDRAPKEKKEKPVVVLDTNLFEGS